MSSEMICAKCSQVQDTCCETSDVYVTPGDVRRISAHVGQDPFFEFRGTVDPSYLDQDDDPTWRTHVVRSDGTRRVLRREPSGACVFLGEHGCRLTLDVRPLVCRLHPYRYDEWGILPVLADGCPLQLVRHGRGLLGELGMEIEAARSWHRLLYEEVRGEAEPVTGSTSFDQGSAAAEEVFPAVDPIIPNQPSAGPGSEARF